MKIELDPGFITPYGEEWLYRYVLDQPPIAGGASFGNVVENKVLDHLTNQASYTMPAPYLGLWTTTPDDTFTAATATELDLHHLCAAGDHDDQHVSGGDRVRSRTMWRSPSPRSRPAVAP